jgi:hypothetical protein
MCARILAVLAPRFGARLDHGDGFIWITSLPEDRPTVYPGGYNVRNYDPRRWYAARQWAHGRITQMLNETAPGWEDHYAVWGHGGQEPHLPLP